MNFGRSRIAQGNEDVQNRDSWVLATPKRLILPERAPVPVDLQKNKMGNGTWQELLGMYSEILIQDEAVQTSNPTSVMVLNSGATNEANRNVGSYVQNFSHGSAGSSNNRVAELVGLRTPEIVASTDKRQQSSHIWHRGSNSNSSTQVASNWTQPRSNNLTLIRQNSILGSNQALPVYNRYNQVGSNLISSESTDLMLQKQNFTYGSSQRLNSLYTQVGSNWLEPQANHLVLAKENCILGSNQRLSDSSSSKLPDDGYLVPYQPNHNANSPPRPVTNAELSAASSFHFAPVTPDQGKQLSRQALSERLNNPLDECSSQEKDKQWNVVTSGSGEIENHPNEFSQIIVDSASTVLSTPLKEKDISDEVGEHGLDLNKTPDQKTPKKRKHRPKVVKEAKPKSGQKSTSPKTKVTNVSPSGKRKYVRKKNLKTAESQQDIVANEGTLPTVESATKECRRALNFDLEHGTGDASKMTNSHQAATHQVNKRPFNLNIEAEDKEICTTMDSMSRTSAIQIEQFRQQKEYNAKNLQTATEQISSQYALTEQSAPCTVPPKSKGHALNVIARNVNQNSSGRGYNHVLEHSRGEEIRRDYIQADSLSANVYVPRHPSTQLAVGDSGSWHENRGFKRSHCDIVEQIHPHTQNLTGKPKYQKQQASAALHAYREQVAENVYQLEAHASYYQQVVESCSSNMSTNEQILKPVPKKQRSHRAEKVFLQQKNNALEIYQQTPKKARGKPAKHKMEYLIEELTFWLEGLSINSRRDVVEQEQHALVPYKGSNVIVPYEGFDNIKKRKPRPKVNIDPETDRIWKLLMGSEGGETAESTDKDKEKWWEEEREVFNRRAKSFIARMHQVQGDRRFSRWKGSVVDSVIGVFLTQNVSDHLSSSAFMSLAATFPLQSSVIVEEPDIQIIESNGSTRCHEQIGRQAYDPLNFQVSEGKIISSTRTHVSAEQQRTDYNSNVNNSPLKTTLSTELTLQNDIHSHVNNSSLFGGISTTKWHAQSEDPLLRHNYPGGSAILLHQTNSHILHIREPVPSSREIQLNMTPELRLKENHNFGILREESLPTFPNSPPTHSEITNMQGANLVRRWMTDTAEGKTHAQQNGMPTVQAPILGPPTFLGNHPTHKGSVQPDYNLKSSMNNHELDNSENFHLERTLITEPARQATGETEKSHGPHTQKLLDNAIEANAVEQSNSSVMPLNVTTTKVSHAKKGKAMAERKNKIDWDNLRKEAQSSGKRERSRETMDSLDYEAMRCSDVKKIADAIKERGMNNMLAERIKDFLNRLIDDHGSIDLEWLRDAPPDKAKDYLLSFRGLGLKSVECVRLLTLHQLAFPVDTNVGRIAVRLGWVPLQPLPESLQLHLLELYPILESIQKYLWPRLCKLDQETLYELHYQMITFGKVFCTKSKPNCNACPLRGECRHFASAFASARLALPGPEERNIVSSAVPFRADGDPLAAINPVPLLEAVQDQNKDAGTLTRKEEPIVEEPSTPEHEITEFVESDIEDAFCDDPDEIPTIKLNIEEFTMNLQNYMQNMELQEGDMSRALVALNPEAASIPAPKLKNVSRLRTEHQVYQLPDSHPLLEGMDQREPDDPSPYLLAIWTPGETADSIQPPEQRCESHESGQLCNDSTCFTCNSTRESNSQIVRGTILIPCRTATRGSFPLNGTYFQVNEMFADHESSVNPIHVPRSLIWNLPRRTVYFGTSVTSIFRGLPTEGIQYCFWKGFVCVRGFDQKRRAPRPLMARLHFPASKLAKNRKNEENT